MDHPGGRGYYYVFVPLVFRCSAPEVEMRSTFVRLGLLLAAAAVVSVGWAQSGTPVAVRLELSQNFYYAGEPLLVRISVLNDGPAALANPVKGPLFAGFKVSAVGAEPAQSLKPKGKSRSGEPSRPEELAAHSFYGAVVDLGDIFPELRRPGTYQVHWTGNGLLSEQLTVQVIPKYDQARRYKAEITTNLGTFHVGFYPDQSPVAVKAFVDMAHAGFYDGLLFHEVRPDDFISGGNAAASGSSRRPFIFPAESSALPLVAGSVVLRPVSPAPLANGSEFMVLLRPQPTLMGQVTVIGQVVNGLEVAREISRQASSGQIAAPFFKPVKDVRILKITILQETEPGQASGPSD
jgi:cyclophilin family peptidyl-prolyl cis-trans isomerase